MAQIVKSYGTPELAKMADVAIRNIHFWRQSGLIKPHVQNTTGKGIFCRWNFRDVVIVGMIRDLRAAGMSLQSIRKSIKAIRRIEGDDALRHAYLVTDGHHIFTIEDEKRLVEWLRQPGQYHIRFTWDVGAAIVEIEKRERKVIAARAA